MIEIENIEEKMRVEERFLYKSGYTVDYPKSYRENIEYRMKLLTKAEGDEKLQKLLKERGRRDIWMFFNVFLWTPDPRREVKSLPFITYEFQDEYLMELRKCYEGGIDLLTEKSRDMGASMMMLGFIIHCWIYETRFSALLGSYIEDLVDNRTEDSHFGRLEYMIDRLPRWMKPAGFDMGVHRNSMKIENPETKGIINGYAPTDRFSRAGRYNLIFADEFAFWKHGRTAWTAMGDATKVRFVTSTPCGKGNKYAELALKGKIRKYTMKWDRHPLKPQSWYEEQKNRRTEEEIAQELDINYNKSLTGRVYPGFTEWNYQEKQEYRVDEPLFVSWDFGLSDATAVIWLQVTKEGEVRVIDALQKTKVSIDWFVPFMTGVIPSGRGFKYDDEEVKMIEKHRDWQEAIHYGDPTGNSAHQTSKTSVIKQLREVGIYVQTKYGKEFQFKERHTATQLLIRRLKVDKDLFEFIDAIENYVFPQRNENSQSTNEVQKPVHNWASHFSTALEYYAVNENLKLAKAGKMERKLRMGAENLAENILSLYPKRKQVSKNPYKTCA